MENKKIIRVIRLNKIDELLKDFKEMGNEGETFSQFIEVSKLIFDNDELDLFDWEEVEEINLKEVRDDN